MMPASYSRIFAIALPIMLSNAMLPLIGMVDAAVIGRMGAVAPLAAVGIGGTFIAMMFWLFNFFDITTTAVVSRARGAGDFAPIEKHLRRSFVLALMLALVIIALIPFWLWLAPVIFASSADITPFLKTYIGIRLLATPAAFLSHILTGYLLGFERTKTVLSYELLIQSLNVILDIVFVMALGWGVAGVAAASVIAEYSGLVFAFFLLRKDLAPIFSRWPRSLKMEAGAKAFLSNNGFLFLRALALHMVIVFFFRSSAVLGDQIAALNTVLMIFVNFAAQATDGFAVAVEIFVGQGLGQKDIPKMRKNILRTSAVSAAIAGVIILVFILFGDGLFALISTNAALRQMAPEYLPWVAISIAIGVISWSLDGVFFGANKGREMMIAMALTLMGYLALIYILVPLWGNHGLWLAFAGSYALRAFGLMLFYPRVEREAQP